MADRCFNRYKCDVCFDRQYEKLSNWTWDGDTIRVCNRCESLAMLDARIEQGKVMELPIERWDQELANRANKLLHERMK